MSEKRISVGDRVFITFLGGHDYWNGTVSYIPVAPGDSWILLRNGVEVVYVNTFETMVKQSPPTPEAE